MPVHTFLRLEIAGDTLRMAAMDPDWLKGLLKRDPSMLRHELLDGDGDLLITASTPELQAFVVAHRDTEGAWGDYSVLGRVEGRPAPASAMRTSPGM